MLEIGALHTLFKASSGVCTDTRKIIKEGMFFALKGGNFDGNQYAKQALDAGCSYAVVDDASLYKNQNDSRILLVSNAEKTLQDLANFHRKELQCPVLALTGSNGKTTTKELISAVLERKYRLNATKGNLNNHLGVPFTLLDTPLDIEFLVVEMGANHQREIDFLCRIAEPQFGLICNIGKAHLEGFGGIEGVKKGKTEMYHFLNEVNGKVFYNSAENSIAEFSDLPSDKIVYGADGEVKLLSTHLNDGKLCVKLIVRGEEMYINSQLHGDYNVQNILTAAAVGVYFDVAFEDIIAGIEAYRPKNNRSEQKVTEKDNLLVLDAYNANPTSMRNAVENMFKIYESKDLVFLLGDMKELGDESFSAHKEIAEVFKGKSVDVVLTGNEFHALSSEFDYSFCKDVEELANLLSQRNYHGKKILIKGSRGIALEKVESLL